VSDDRLRQDQEHESAARHPIKAAEHEVEHLAEVAEEGESDKTPLIVIGTILVVSALIVAVVLALALVIAHYLG
jgi:hypothetical protein